MSETLEKLEKILEMELDKIAAKGTITPAELESATKAVCLMEKIKMVEDMDLGSSYSRGNYNSYRQGQSNRYYRNSNMYPGDYYSQDRSYDYSMDRGYSGHSVRDRMIAQLESNMMDNAQSESERRTIESLISQLGSSNH